MDRKDIQDLLNIIGEEKGIGEIALDEHGYCSVYTTSGDIIHMYYDIDKDSFLILSVLGDAPAPDDPDSAFVYARLMEANLFWDATVGATLARENDGFIVLQQMFPLVNSPELGDFLEHFANLVEFWKNQYEEIRKAQTEELQPFFVKL